MSDHRIADLTVGVLSLLIVASLSGALLHWRGRGRAPSSTIQNLNARIRAWWGMVAVLGVCFWIGPTATVVLFAFAS